jgi:DNA repair protein RadC
VDESAIYAREVVESAIRKKASALIFVHNHPNGQSIASAEDKTLTTELISACKAVRIPVLDHVVIGQDGFLSMRRKYPELFT